MFARAPLHRSGGRRLFLCEPVSSDLNRGVANHATATTVSTLLYRAMFEGPTDRRVLDNGRVDTGAAVFSGSRPTGFSSSRPTGFSGSRPTRFSGSRPTGACICRRQVSEYHCRRDHRGRDCRHDSPHVCTSSFRPCVSLIHLTIKTEMTRDFRRGAHERKPLASQPIEGERRRFRRTRLRKIVAVPTIRSAGRARLDPNRNRQSRISRSSREDPHAGERGSRRCRSTASPRRSGDRAPG